LKIYNTQADLKTARAIVANLEAEGDTVNTILGLFTIRLVNHMCDKGKNSFEHVAHDSFHHIRTLFVKELINKIKHPETFTPPDGWSGALEREAKIAKVDAVSNMVDRLNTIDEVGGPAAALKRQGLSIGSIINEKGVRSVTHYMITSFDFEHEPPLVEAKEIVELTDRVPNIIKVLVSDIAAGWKCVLKYEPIIATSCSAYSQFMVDESSLRYKIEVAKHKLSKAILSAPHVNLQDLLISFKPLGFYAGRIFEFGELKLTPKVLMGNMCADTTRQPKDGDIQTEVAYKFRDGSFGPITIVKPHMASTADATRWQASVMFSPYFHISQTDSIDAANMHVIDVIVNGITLPCMVNYVKLQKYDKLQYFVAANKKKDALSDAYSVHTPAPNDAAPAKAKAKAKSTVSVKPKASVKATAKVASKVKAKATLRK
jgi:hypothetical protein